MQRRHFTQEFKAEAVRQALLPRVSKAQVAQDLGAGKFALQLCELRYDRFSRLAHVVGDLPEKVLRRSATAGCIPLPRSASRKVDETGFADAFPEIIGDLARQATVLDSMADGLAIGSDAELREVLQVDLGEGWDGQGIAERCNSEASSVHPRRRATGA